MGILFRYLKNYKKESVLAPLFKMLEATFELLVPLVVAVIVDRGIAEGDKGIVIQMSLLLLGLGIVGLGCSVTAQFFSARAATGASAEIKASLLDKIQSMSYTALDKAGIATLITRMTGDVSQVQTGINLTLRLLLRSPFVVVGAVAVAFTVDVPSAMIFVFTVPVLAIIIFAVLLVTIPMYKKVQQRLDRVTGAVRENHTGTRVIRAFRKEAHEVGLFEESTKELLDHQKKTARISALLNPLTYAVISLGIIVLLYRGAFDVDSGRISQGELLALHGLMSQILVELVKFANLVITVTKSIAGAKRIEQVMHMDDTAPAVTETGADDGCVVRFDGVSLTYSGAGDKSLDGISFSVKRGERVGIIGGTGSGKSSLVNLIPGFYSPTEGSVRTLGTTPAASSSPELLSKIAVVPQKAVLFSGTVRSNVAVGKPDATDGEIEEAIRLAQIGELLDESRGGLDAPVLQGGRNLSGGQRQRLTVARALVRRPEILILDDSASALDLATEAALRRAVDGMKETTVFTVSQRASSVMNCDMILVLENGELVGKGDHRQLLESCEVYREIYHSQFPDGEVSADEE